MALDALILRYRLVWPQSFLVFAGALSLFVWPTFLALRGANMGIEALRHFVRSANDSAIVAVLSEYRPNKTPTLSPSRSA